MNVLLSLWGLSFEKPHQVYNLELYTLTTVSPKIFLPSQIHVMSFLETHAHIMIVWLRAFITQYHRISLMSCALQFQNTISARTYYRAQTTLEQFPIVFNFNSNFTSNSFQFQFPKQKSYRISLITTTCDARNSDLWYNTKVKLLRNPQALQIIWNNFNRRFFNCISWKLGQYNS